MCRTVVNFRLSWVLLVALALMPLSNANAGFVVALNLANELVGFDSSDPTTALNTVSISGLNAGDSLIGIDVRPSNGQLYGLAANGTAGTIYILDAVTGAATFQSNLNQALNGNFYGVDFNPVADRLRIVSDSGMNYRTNVMTGATTVDTPLAFDGGDINAGSSPQVVEIAYTNSFAGAVSTTLYDIDNANQLLLIQNPPNNGTLTTVASLGGISFPDVAFDIEGASTGFISLNGIEFASFNLSDGSITPIGDIASGTSIVDFAANVTAVPEPTSLALVGLAAAAGLQIRRRKLSKKS